MSYSHFVSDLKGAMFCSGVCSLTWPVILLLALNKCSPASVPSIRESWKRDWFQEGQSSLEETLSSAINTNVAKNVIFFLGDGMGVSTVTAGRIYMAQKTPGGPGEEASLSFEKFPHVALAKTYNVDYQVPDSAGTATAFLCGVKANLGTIGVDQSVEKSNCDDVTEASKVSSILRWSIQEGKRTGVVTTTRITHATPAASYAHSPHRDWESDSNVASKDRGKCVDIAKQLITENNDINVILGGGRKQFLPNDTIDPEYGNSSNGSRLDGLNLIQEWLKEARKRSASATFVWNQTQFDQVNPETTDFLLGLFEPSHMKYYMERRDGDSNEPSLAQMTEKAIRILRRGKNGYFLLVEGGRIDHGHHANSAKYALEELVSFDEAIQTAVRLTDHSDTLIVVTADHSHVFTISGYPSRGNPILGFVDERGSHEEPAEDGMPYPTLSYANGPSQNLGRTNLTGIDPQGDNFTQPASIPMASETHGGEDVAVYARGPMSHLFHGVQEQHYIAHAMAYASCVGTNKNHCSAKRSSGSRLRYTATGILSMASIVAIVAGSISIGLA